MRETPSHSLIAVLDACVLFPASLRDSLLRLAESPAQYIPRWSDQILVEVSRNLERRRNLTPEKTSRLVRQLDLYFPEAIVTGYERLIPFMTNDPKDRHVLAAAVHSGADCVVTSNLRDFPPASLTGWGIEAVHPDDFLIEILERHSEVVITKLQDQAETIGRTLPELLRTLHGGVPRFAAQVAFRTGSA